MRLYKPLETPGANWAAATSLTVIAHQVAGKAVRDALFLSNYRANSLPYAMASAAVLSLGAVIGLSRLMSRHSPSRILPILFALSAGGLAMEWYVGFGFPRLAALLVYFHTALFGPTLMTTFWSLINERFDPHTAKRAVARIAGGGTLGGVIGGLATWRASTLFPLPTLLLFLAALNASAIVGAILIRQRRKPTDDAAPGALPPPVNSGKSASPIETLRKAPFLRNLALLVAAGSATSTLLDYMFSAQAALAFAKGAPLLHFFSLFWLAVSVVSFLLQITLGRIALERLGLAVSIAFLPGTIVLGGALGLAVPGLTSASLLRGGEAVQRNTLFRSAYELLYTPLSEAQKRTTKAVIDVGFDRVGTVMGSAIAIVMIRFASGHAPAALLGVVVVLAIATLPLTRQLHVGYVAALQESLREGSTKLDVLGHPDRARESIEIGAREKLIDRVEAIAPGGLTSLLEGQSTADVAEVAGIASPAGEALHRPRTILARTAELLSGDEERVKRALKEISPRGPSAACAIYLLAHKMLHLPALSALRSVGPSMVGQLIDALLDEKMDFVVRRRIPRVLAACPSQRTADGLLLGIATERFEVRYQCGRALLRVTDADRTVVIARDKVIEAVQREIASAKTALEKVASEDFDDDLQADENNELMEMLARDRVDRSLEQVFAILSLHLEREPLRMAFRALHHEDTRHRGTALEYLETILPNEVRETLWPYLGAETPLITARPATELLADLASAAGLEPSTGSAGRRGP
ncbi:MAG: hypothetical protein M3O46_11375 [Myxococcota bacterium]|nr:hypothetical protein [Myxococcota bacterium]